MKLKKFEFFRSGTAGDLLIPILNPPMPTKFNKSYQLRFTLPRGTVICILTTFDFLCSNICFPNYQNQI